jgi:diguanylate cyclase
VISGAFLLTGITFFPPAADPAEGVAAELAPETAPLPATAPLPGTSAPAAPPPIPPMKQAIERSPPAPVRPASLSVPFEKEGRTLFVDSGAIAALRAEGHYCRVFHGNESHLSPWSISEAEGRLAAAGFLRVHRSYLVNPRLVTGFERGKDGGQVTFASAPALGAVPVSRTRLTELRAALGV